MTVCRSRAVSASRGSTTSICTTDVPCSTGRHSAHPKSTESASRLCWKSEPTMTATNETEETLSAFETRARAWIEANLPPWDDDRIDDVVLQRRLFDAGFAGIAFPR